MPNLSYLKILLEDDGTPDIIQKDTVEQYATDYIIEVAFKNPTISPQLIVGAFSINGATSVGKVFAPTLNRIQLDTEGQESGYIHSYQLSQAETQFYQPELTFTLAITDATGSQIGTIVPTISIPMVKKNFAKIVPENLSDDASSLKSVAEAVYVLRDSIPDIIDGLTKENVFDLGLIEIPAFTPDGNFLADITLTDEQKQFFVTNFDNIKAVTYQVRSSVTGTDTTFNYCFPVQDKRKYGTTYTASAYNFGSVSSGLNVQIVNLLYESTSNTGLTVIAQEPSPVSKATTENIGGIKLKGQVNKDTRGYVQLENQGEAYVELIPAPVLDLGTLTEGYTSYTLTPEQVELLENNQYIKFSEALLFRTYKYKPFPSLISTIQYVGYLQEPAADKQTVYFIALKTVGQTANLLVQEVASPNATGTVVSVGGNPVKTLGFTTDPQTQLNKNAANLLEYKTTNDSRVDAVEADLSAKQNILDNSLETSSKEITGAINELKTDVDSIRQDILNEAHFRGYFATDAELQASDGNLNDFAYSAESLKVWVYGASGWAITSQEVPSSAIPAGNNVPLMNGVGAAGGSTSYSREDHVHPTDTTRASVTEINKIKDGTTIVKKAEQDELGRNIKDTYATKTYVDDFSFNGSQLVDGSVTEQKLSQEVQGKLNKPFTEVVANPTLAGNEPELTGLEVNGSKYKVPSGGGTNNSTLIITDTLPPLNEDNFLLGGLYLKPLTTSLYFIANKAVDPNNPPIETFATIPELARFSSTTAVFKRGDTYYVALNNSGRDLCKISIKTGEKTIIPGYFTGFKVLGKKEVPVVGKYAYMFSINEEADSSTTDKIMRIDLDTDTVELMPERMPVKLSFSTQCVIGTDIYLIGGIDYTSGSGEHSKHIYKFNTLDNSFADLGEVLPYGGEISLAVPYNNAIYIAGFVYANTDRKMRKYDITTNAITQLATLGGSPNYAFLRGGIVDNIIYYCIPDSTILQRYEIENNRNLTTDARLPFSPSSNTGSTLSANNTIYFNFLYSSSKNIFQLSGTSSYTWCKINSTEEATV